MQKIIRLVDECQSRERTNDAYKLFTILVKVDNILVHMPSYRENNIIFMIRDPDYLFPPIFIKIRRNSYLTPDPEGLTITVIPKTCS